MSTVTTTIKNNTIILPEIIGRKLEDKEVLLKDIGTKIILEIIPDRIKTKPTNALHKLSGLLKGRLSLDPVDWQRKIRQEWERKLP